MAGHGNVSGTFLLHRRRKTENEIDNEIHVTAETIFISKHSYSSAILAKGAINRRYGILDGVSTLCIELHCENCIRVRGSSVPCYAAKQRVYH